MMTKTDLNEALLLDTTFQLVTAISLNNTSLMIQYFHGHKGPIAIHFLSWM